MSAAVGSSGGGGRKGSDDPFKKREPESKASYDEDEDEEEDDAGKNKVKCKVCKRWLNVSLAEHCQDCPKEQDWSGEFRCFHPGCGATVRYYGELLRHWRQNHGNEEMPARMRNRLK